MRKKVSGYQLNRNTNQRKALLRSLVSCFIENNKIETTIVKAKAIQPEIEKLITKAKAGTIADRRSAHRFLTKTHLVNKLFDVIGPVFKDRNGGYTKIVRIGNRRGDNAMMVKMFLTEEIPLVEIVKPKEIVKDNNIKKELIQEAGKNKIKKEKKVKKVEKETKTKK